MSIEILPARLANQIAAGEVVERPASVIKELVENSLDAGATKIQIDVEKGGAKRIRIIDNGKGIVKDELTLALSRHATSKIKDLNDLEAISSLGFRGEALASISSVARLTLTSKPAQQANAWQAYAEGRDMQVVVQPAAHPDGTTIDVEDLFFNTPARKKFMRTEKTEFSHIEEVIRRIALARFDVTFILNHNHKQVRQYRAAKDSSHYSKRVAQICGQRFIDHSLEVNCQHDNLHLSGWLATPDYHRNQNDLCYSYVNGRMMRDKLINHAIRQAYADMLPRDTYAAFVLFLELDFSEVDVNVHPAKHEVRFHQGRFVHDFIYSVCRDALVAQASLLANEPQANEHQSAAENTAASPSTQENFQQTITEPQVIGQPSYIKPLAYQYAQPANESRGQQSSGGGYRVSKQAVSAYQELMTPLTESGVDSIESSQNLRAQAVEPIKSSAASTSAVISTRSKAGKLIGQFVQPSYLSIGVNNELRLVSLTKLAQACYLQLLQSQWSTGLVSQPLLLPIKLKVSVEQLSFFNQYQEQLKHLGLVFVVTSTTSMQIRQFPAVLRHQDVSACVYELYEYFQSHSADDCSAEVLWQQAMSALMVSQIFSQDSANQLLEQAKTLFNDQLAAQLLLNSVVIDLTSEIGQLTNL